MTRYPGADPAEVVTADYGAYLAGDSEHERSV